MKVSLSPTLANKGTVLALLLLAFLLAACAGEGMDHGEMDMDDDGMMGMPEQDIPADLDQSLQKETEDGLFTVELAPAVDPIPLNEIHEWNLTVRDDSGELVDDAAVTIGGGMPQHNHGFPTEPVVTATDDPGVYLVEGMKYQMSGWWEMSFDIDTDTASDSVTFNIVLP